MVSELGAIKLSYVFEIKVIVATRERTDILFMAACKLVMADRLYEDANSPPHKINEVNLESGRQLSQFHGCTVSRCDKEFPYVNNLLLVLRSPFQWIMFI